jgi:signal peptidase
VRRRLARPALRVLSWASYALLVALLAGVIGMLVAPRALGWRYGILRSGSMSPALPAGSAIVVEPAGGGAVRPGDVITYRSALSRDLLITHRVLEVTRDPLGRTAFVTKGDANEERDTGLVTADRLVGRVVLHVPHVGQAAQKLHTRAGFFALLVVPTALIIALELRELHGGVRDLMRQRKRKLEAPAD